MPKVANPTFVQYPPAQREWAFASDAIGQRLQAVWDRIDVSGSLLDNPDFLDFAAALRGAIGTQSPPSPPPGRGNVAPVTGRSGVVTRDDPRSGSTLSQMAIERKVVSLLVPASSEEMEGVPNMVLRRLVDALLSAAVCHCGHPLKMPRGECPVHGLAEVSWRRIFPAGYPQGGGGASTEETAEVHELAGRTRTAGTAVEHKYSAVPEAGSCPEGESKTSRGSGGRGVPAGPALRRECLVQALRVLAAVGRWPHTREEMARQTRLYGGGGIAKTLVLLLDALCARVADLRRRCKGPLRSRNSDASAPSQG